MDNTFDALLSLCFSLHNRHKNAFERLSESDQQEWLNWMEQAKVRIAHMKAALRQARIERADADAAGLAPLSRLLYARNIDDLRAAIGMINDMRRARIPVGIVAEYPGRDWPAKVWSASAKYMDGGTDE